MNTATTTSIVIAVLLVAGLLIWGATTHAPISNQTPTSQSQPSASPAPLTSDQMNMSDLSTESQSITSTDVQFSSDLNNLQTTTNGL